MLGKYDIFIFNKGIYEINPLFIKEIIHGHNHLKLENLIVFYLKK